MLVHNSNGCELVARQIQDDVGGEIFRIGNSQGRYPMGSTHPLDDGGRWVYHEFVVKDGLVFDAGFPSGLPMDQFLELFPGWSVDDLVAVGAG